MSDLMPRYFRSIIRSLVRPLTSYRGEGATMPRLPDWPAPAKPAELAYNRLIEAILDGSFPANTVLPGERQLAEMLGVTRPTLRETLQQIGRASCRERV